MDCVPEQPASSASSALPQKKPLQVYHRRPPPVADPAQPASQSSTSSGDPSADLPIALRKGTRSCTKHPIANFVSFHRLSPLYRNFALSFFIHFFSS